MNVKTIVIVAALLTGLMFAAVAFLTEQLAPPREITLYASNMPGVKTVHPGGICLRDWMLHAYDGETICAPEWWPQRLEGESG